MRHLAASAGANAARSRDHNRQLVLGQLHASGPMGRADLARRAGLSTQAVSNITAELESDGLLRIEGTARGRRGLPARQYSVNADGGFALGLEIRPRVLLATLLDLSGACRWETRHPLSRATPAAVIAALPGLRDAALSTVPAARDRLLGAGVALPGPFGVTGVKGAASELADWPEDAGPALAACLDLPVVVENDANAAATSERIVLAPQGIATFACLYFGTGLGLAIVQDGRLVVGAHGNAGEIGHVPVSGPDGLAPLEDLVSRMSVERHLAVHGTPVQDMTDLAARFDAGDPALMDWLLAARAPFAQAVALIENLFDPQTIVLCGAMPEGIVRSLVSEIDLPARSVARRPDARHPALMVGACTRRAAAVGAAALILNRTFTPSLAA